MTLCLPAVAAACCVSIQKLHECKVTRWTWFRLKDMRGGMEGGWRPAGHCMVGSRPDCLVDQIRALLNESIVTSEARLSMPLK